MRAREEARRAEFELARQRTNAQRAVNTAEAERDAVRARADGQAYRTLREAEAEASAIRARGEAEAAALREASAAAYARLQAEWTANVSTAAAVAAGKVPVVWQPTAEGPGDPAWDNALPASTVYMVWLNQQSLVGYTTAGRDVVYTTPFYVAVCPRPRRPRKSTLESSRQRA